MVVLIAGGEDVIGMMEKGGSDTLLTSFKGGERGLEVG